MNAQELMTANPTCIAASAKVRDAVDMLSSLEVRHLPVVNDDNEVVGMLSDRDLRALQIPDVTQGEVVGRVQRALDATVSSLMSSDVLAVGPEADVQDVVDLMLDHKVGAVPVVDGDGGLVGIISYMDVLKAAEFD